MVNSNEHARLLPNGIDYCDEKFNGVGPGGSLKIRFWGKAEKINLKKPESQKKTKTYNFSKVKYLTCDQILFLSEILNSDAYLQNILRMIFNFFHNITSIVNLHSKTFKISILNILSENLNKSYKMCIVFF